MNAIADSILALRPSAVEFGWRQTGNYAAFLVESTTAGLSLAS